MLSKEKKLKLLTDKLENLSDDAIDKLYDIFIKKKILYNKDEIYEYYENNREKIKNIIKEINGELIAEIFDFALLAKEIYPMPIANYFHVQNGDYVKFIISYIALYEKRAIILSVIMTFAELNDSSLDLFIKNYTNE